LKKTVLLILSIIPYFSLFADDVITGRACYKYSDLESLEIARDIALSMAKREALESYSPYIASSSVIKSNTLKNDLIVSITANKFKNFRVIDETENTSRNKVCRTIQAEVNESDIIEEVKFRTDLNRKKKVRINTGLWENRIMKWLKIEKVDNGNFLKIRFMCKMGKSAWGNNIDNWHNYDIFHKPGRSFTIICLDNENLPLKNNKYQEHYCSEYEGNSLGHFYVPNNVSIACKGLNASDYSLEWSDK